MNSEQLGRARRIIIVRDPITEFEHTPHEAYERRKGEDDDLWWPTPPGAQAIRSPELAELIRDAIEVEDVSDGDDAKAAARDFAKALREIAGTQDPDAWRIAAEALARHPEYSG
jgi:hypothetical protein